MSDADGYTKACELLKSLGADPYSLVSARAHITMVLSQTLGRSQNAQDVKEIEKALTTVHARSVSTMNARITNILSEKMTVADEAAKIDLMNELVMCGRQLQQLSPPAPTVADPMTITLLVRKCIVSKNSYLRICGLRLARAFLFDPTFVDCLWKNKAHWFIAQSLDRDAKQSKERDQALKFVFHMNLHNAGLLPTPLVMRIVSLAESGEEGMRRRCVELLRDLLVRSPRSAALGGAVRLLLSAALDATLSDISHTILNAVLYTLEKAHGRRYLRLFSDVSVLMSPFSEKLPTDAKLLKEVFGRMRAARTAILHVVRTWPGLFWLASDPQGLRTLVDVLYFPGSTERKMIIFELFNSLLRTAAPHRPIAAKGPWTHFEGEVSGHFRLGSFGLSAQDLVSVDMSFCGTAEKEVAIGDIDNALLSDTIREDTESSMNVTHVHVLDAFLGTVLLVLEREGLTKALISLVREGISAQESHTSQSAAQLLQQVLAIMETLFPRELVLELHTSFDVVISTMLSERPISDMALGSDRVKTLMSRLHHDHESIDVRARSGLHLGNIKLHLATTMDNAAFLALIRDTQVLDAKEWVRWNVESIMSLIRGPLRLAPRLREVDNKFFKRLLFFLKPSKNLFNSMLRDKHANFATMAYRLVELLLMTKEGTAILTESGLLTELYEKLGEVMNPKVADNARVFNKEHLSYHMTREYFRLIGKCCDHPNGIGLLLSSKIFDILLSLVSLSSDSLDPSDVRNDICHQILKHINFGYVPNYGVNIAARPILIQALTKGSNAIRYFATKELRRTLSSSYNENIVWVLALLTQQLADRFRGVSECALGMICDLCISDDEALDTFISNSPPVQLLMDTELSGVLLLALLRSPAGFQHLLTHNWIQKQREKWCASGNVSYAQSVEGIMADLGAADSGGPSRPSNVASRVAHHIRRLSGDELGTQRLRLNAPVRAAVPGIIPPHFLGELCRTDIGASWLAETTTWGELVKTIFEGIEHLSDADAVTVDANDDLDDIDDAGQEVVGGSNRSVEEPPLKVDPPLASGFADFRTYADLDAFTPPKDTSRCANTHQFRGALWAVAHMGSTEAGFTKFLGPEPGLLTRMLCIAQTCESLSMRGLLLTQLGLIGRSPSGRAALDTAGWVVTLPSDYQGSNGQMFSSCFAHPKSMTSWIHIPRAKYRGTIPPMVHSTRAVMTKYAQKLSPGQQEVLRHLGGLTSPVLHETSIKELKKMATLHPHVFLDPEFYLHVVRIVSYAKCKTVYRRAVMELFSGVALTPNVLAAMDSASAAQQQGSVPRGANESTLTESFDADAMTQ